MNTVILLKLFGTQLILLFLSSLSAQAADEANWGLMRDVSILVAVGMFLSGTVNLITIIWSL